MNIKEIIEHKAREHWSLSKYKEASEEAYAKDDMCKTSAMARKVSYSSFKAGAEAAIEIANAWIPTEERLPTFDPGKYPNGDYERYPVRVSQGLINKKEIITLGWLTNMYGKWNVEMDWVKVTHWKPITL